LSGLKETFETEEMFSEFGGLFTREAVAERLEDRETREGRHLAEFAVHYYIERRLRELTERIANEENAVLVECREEAVPFRSAWGQLMTECDSARRRALEEGVAEAVARQNAERAERVAGQSEIARELGFADYRGLCEELSGQRLEALGEEMGGFLEETEEVYRARVAEALSEVGLKAEEATDADLRWVVLGLKNEELFPVEKLLPAADTTLEGLGVGPAQQGHVHLDLEPRPKKYPRPFCSLVAVPEEVWVVAAPRGGCVDYLSFFHELGHAQHFAHMSPRLPWAYRLTGDDALTEGFAFALQAVVLEAGWLREVMGVEPVPEELLEAGRLLDFWYVRRYAGKIAYELELHRGKGPVEAMAERYARLLGGAMGVRANPEHYLFDVDDRFYCACYLRAWRFEACLREQLRERFGESWFRRAETGAWLRSLWERGTELTAEEMAEELGMECGLGPLRDRLLRDG